MKIIQVVGARPNFMKVAPVMFALEKRSGVTQCLVHTGQHYDKNMSDIFFTQLGLPEPDINLGVGSTSHAVQTAQIMIKFEEVVNTEKPDWVLVYGDVNSTMAASLVCAKLGIPVAHVEAGLRSGDLRMPEEINRLVTDRLASLLLTPSADADQNLLAEGADKTKIKIVGNVMIDTLVRLLPKAEPPPLKELGDKYVLVTLHRPSNVDAATSLRNILETLDHISKDIQVVFPMHPRTRKRIAELNLELPSNKRILVTDPLGYLQFLGLQRGATALLTDSGGVQEETTYLGIPCLTLRENTERPITITEGSNILVGKDMDLVKQHMAEILSGRGKKGKNPDLWDGKAGHRIADILAST